MQLGESSPSDGPSTPEDARERLSASAHGWHKIQLGVLGFIGICGVLRSADTSVPRVVQVVAAILAVAAVAVACAAIFSVGRVAYPIEIASNHDADVHELTDARKRLRAGIRLTVLALLLIVVAAVVGMVADEDHRLSPGHSRRHDRPSVVWSNRQRAGRNRQSYAARAANTLHSTDQNVAGRQEQSRVQEPAPAEMPVKTRSPSSSGHGADWRPTNLDTEKMRSEVRPFCSLASSSRRHPSFRTSGSASSTGVTSTGPVGPKHGKDLPTENCGALPTAAPRCPGRPSLRHARPRRLLRRARSARQRPPPVHLPGHRLRAAPPGRWGRANQGGNLLNTAGDFGVATPACRYQVRWRRCP